ncbi:MAG TPA: hypothetical protein VL860_05045 [Planctomycetota bacterium]|nr:hypothetical protein [Planctomycetota bacterium]
MPIPPYDPRSGPHSKSLPDANQSDPVILLTGYEPFGGAAINPSWEAVRGYDRTVWHGYQLVAAQLPVIWGAPLPALQKRMAALQPVAVFSFGQGKPDGFHLETLARRERGSAADNDGKKAVDLRIADGPAQYDSTDRVRKIHQALAAQGYPIVLSHDAGQYLCEECLYSLEYLRATAFKTTHVQFCHVPSLGLCIGPNRTEVTLEYLVRFVADVLEAWRK